MVASFGTGVCSAASSCFKKASFDSLFSEDDESSFYDVISEDVGSVLFVCTFPHPAKRQSARKNTDRCLIFNFMLTYYPFLPIVLTYFSCKHYPWIFFKLLNVSFSYKEIVSTKSICNPRACLKIHSRNFQFLTICTLCFALYLAQI